MRFAVCQIGARRHYAVPAMLQRAGMLARLYTDGCRNAGLWRAVDRWSPRRLRPGLVRRMLERDVPDVPPGKIATLDRFGLWRAWAGRRCRTPDQTLGHYARANRRFGREVVSSGLADADAVYVFNAAGKEILEHARDRGLYRVLDQTMAPFAVVEPMLAEERERWPGWEQQGHGGDGWRRLADREAAEWPLGDRIICGSDYVADSLARLTGSRDLCRVVPYGIDVGGAACQPPATDPQPLRVLFAGTLGLRKGVPDLLQAARQLSSDAAEFRAVGPSELSERAMQQVARRIDWRGPVHRHAMAEHYAWADVLVLPTLAEGSANVCYEAMAHGRPVITTPNAGSVARDGIDGYIIPIREPDALAERLTTLAEDRHRLQEMGANAHRRLEAFTWNRYERQLVDALLHEPALHA